MRGSDDHSAVDDFLAESQELIDLLSRDVLRLEVRDKTEAESQQNFNDLFRTVHTLKGLSAMFGFADLSRLAHILEDLLDDLRLGKLTLDDRVLDLLYEGTEGLSGLLRSNQEGGNATLDLEAFAESIKRLPRKQVPQRAILEQLGIDPAILAVLTEYEEHRLIENFERGLNIYDLVVTVELDQIETAIDDLKKRSQGIAEIIGYLPTLGTTGQKCIDMAVLLASKRSASSLSEQLGVAESAMKPIRKIASPAMGSFSLASMYSMEPKASSLNAPSQSRAGTTDHEERTLRSLSSMVRVDIRRLDHLLNTVGELGVVRASVARLLQRLRDGELDLRQLTAEMHHAHRSFGRLLNELQGSVLEARMVPLSQLFDKMAVVLRRTIREIGKDARLKVIGADTEVDKLVVEAIADPLMHIVRNAVDHGVEPPDERIALGKPLQAEISIHAYHQGNHVVIEIADDGRGIDPRAVQDAAASKGLLPATSVVELAPTDVFPVLFAPGFTTATEVTDLSGRGVGMDVVKTNIARLGGAVDLNSRLGAGTKITITLPITLAIINVLLFETGGRLLAISLASVQEALRVDEDEFFTVNGREMLTLRGETLSLCRLGKLLRFGEEPDVHRYVILIALGQRRVGLVVDRLLGQQDAVIKALGSSLSDVSGIAGASDLGDGRLVLVLDAAAILDEVAATAGSLQLGEGQHERT